MRAPCFILAVALAGVDLPAAANPPVLVPGTCTWLTGAPPDGVSAASEVRQCGIDVEPECSLTHSEAVQQFGANSVQLYGEPDGIADTDSCRQVAWCEHAFTVAAGTGALLARIDLSGWVKGSQWVFGSVTNGEGIRLDVRIVLIEIDGLTASKQVIASESAFSRVTAGGLTLLDDGFDQSLHARVRADNTYIVRMEVVQVLPDGAMNADLGPPGAGEGVGYDSIEVCIEPPPLDAATLQDALDDLEDSLAASQAQDALDDLEARLYSRDCLPTVWMPAAQGGRLEIARDLAADLLARATATGDPGVNTQVATQRLANADGEIAAGRYQRACRSLSEVVRALTTP